MSDMKYALFIMSDKYTEQAWTCVNIFDVPTSPLAGERRYPNPTLGKIPRPIAKDMMRK
jgi:hypothetical protein